MRRDEEGTRLNFRPYGLTLNTSKTKAIIFGSDKNLAYMKSLSLPQLQIHGDPIIIVNQVKSLGVVLSSDPRWKSHISSISTKVHYTLYTLRQRSWLFDQQTEKMLVQALVMPYIDFACLVYNGSIPLRFGTFCGGMSWNGPKI